MFISIGNQVKLTKSVQTTVKKLIFRLVFSNMHLIISKYLNRGTIVELSDEFEKMLFSAMYSLALELLKCGAMARI